MRAMVECEQLLLSENRQELDREEGIPPGLFVHQLDERLSNRPIAMQRVDDKVLHIGRLQGREHDLPYPGFGTAHHSERAHQRV
jgi:hypothetical protein